jgi:GntR family transcriptional repressor for pyruvate dehydrogenase complex
VSRATLREAMAALREAEMVRTTRGRSGGTVVAYQPMAPAYAQQSTSDAGGTGLAGRREALLDCLTFRRVVEPGACATAASRVLSPDEQQLLATALQEVDGALARNGPAAHRQADSRLHLALASVSGSERILRAVTDVQGCLHEMLQLIPVLPVNIEHSTAQHHAIVEAVLAGSPGRARQAMEQHCDDTAALLRGLLD